MLYAFCRRNHNSQEIQYVYYIELSGETGLLHADREGSLVYGMHLDEQGKFS